MSLIQLYRALDQRRDRAEKRASPAPVGGAGMKTAHELRRMLERCDYYQMPGAIAEILLAILEQLEQRKSASLPPSEETT